jgi:hypothetical protein
MVNKPLYRFYRRCAGLAAVIAQFREAAIDREPAILVFTQDRN